MNKIDLYLGTGLVPTIKATRTKYLPLATVRQLMISGITSKTCTRFVICLGDVIMLSRFGAATKSGLKLAPEYNIH